MKGTVHKLHRCSSLEEERMSLSPSYNRGSLPSQDDLDDDRAPFSDSEEETFNQDSLDEGESSTTFLETLATVSYGVGNLQDRRFRRIFPFNSRRKVSTSSKWSPSTGVSPPGETWFFQNLSLYDDLVGGKLYMKTTNGKRSTGSATLLSPPLLQARSGKFVTYWVTTVHNFLPEKGELEAVCINPEIFHVFRDEHEFTKDVTILRRGDVDYTGLFEAQDFSPTKVRQHPRPFDEGFSDLAFFEVVTDDEDWPSKNGRCPIPHSRRLEEGDLILKIGYPGPVKLEKFQRIHGASMTEEQVKHAWQDVVQNVVPERRFSAAPAEVYAIGVDSRVIKDQGSSWGGMLGCAVLNLKNPELLEGVHIGAAGAKEQNHFLSVHHPFFVLGYADILGPHLRVFEDWPSAADMTGELRRYFEKHKGLLQKANLWHKITI